MSDSVKTVTAFSGDIEKCRQLSSLRSHISEREIEGKEWSFPFLPLTYTDHYRQVLFLHTAYRVLNQKPTADFLRFNPILAFPISRTLLDTILAETTRPLSVSFKLFSCPLELQK